MPSLLDEVDASIAAIRKTRAELQDIAYRIKHHLPLDDEDGEFRRDETHPQLRLIQGGLSDA